MSEHAHSHADDPSHSPRHYVKIWAILAVLAIISYLGPEIRDVFGPEGRNLFDSPTFWQLFILITAFGIAFYKAYLVIKNFMHLNLERAYIRYLFGGMLALMVLFFFFTGADVLQHSGRNWENTAAQEEVQRVMDDPPVKGAHHGDGSEHGQGDHGEVEHDSADHGDAH